MGYNPLHKSNFTSGLTTEFQSHFQRSEMPLSSTNSLTKTSAAITNVKPAKDGSKKRKAERVDHDEAPLSKQSSKQSRKLKKYKSKRNHRRSMSNSIGSIAQMSKNRQTTQQHQGQNERGKI